MAWILSLPATRNNGGPTKFSMNPSLADGIQIFQNGGAGDNVSAQWKPEDLI